MKDTVEGKIDISSYIEKVNSKSYYTIKVSDTGCGISSENLPDIFNRYYQGNGQFQASGTGIGLALVKNLADLHKIEITVDSKVKEGTTFYVRFLSDYDYPQEHKYNANIRTIKSDINTLIQSDTHIIDESEIVILIVEDNRDIR